MTQTQFRYTSINGEDDTISNHLLADYIIRNNIECQTARVSPEVFTAEQIEQIKSAFTEPVSWTLELNTDNNNATSWVRRDESERYLSYQARRKIKESRMRESSDFTNTESEALDEFFAGLDVTEEHLDAD